MFSALEFDMFSCHLTKSCFCSNFDEKPLMYFNIVGGIVCCGTFFPLLSFAVGKVFYYLLIKKSVETQKLNISSKSLSLTTFNFLVKKNFKEWLSV